MIFHSTHLSNKAKWEGVDKIQYKAIDKRQVSHTAVSEYQIAYKK